MFLHHDAPGRDSLHGGAGLRAGRPLVVAISDVELVGVYDLGCREGDN